MVIEANLVPALIKVLNNGEFENNMTKVAWAVTKVTEKGTKEQVGTSVVV